MDSIKGKYFVNSTSHLVNHEDIYMNGYEFILIQYRELLFQYRNKYIVETQMDIDDLLDI